jgi:hypothetical protein
MFNEIVISRRTVMKELTVSEIQEVSGGDISDTAEIFSYGIGLGATMFGTKVGTIGVAAAFIAAPLASMAMLGIAFYAGYRLVGK